MRAQNAPNMVKSGLQSASKIFFCLLMATDPNSQTKILNMRCQWP